MNIAQNTHTLTDMIPLGCLKIVRESMNVYDSQNIIVNIIHKI